MNKDRIIHQGDTAKYQVIIRHEDFDQQTDPFHVVVHGGIPDTPVTIACLRSGAPISKERVAVSS